MELRVLAAHLVKCGIVSREAVEDPDGYDGGITMAKIYMLGRILFHGEEELFYEKRNDVQMR